MHDPLFLSSYQSKSSPCSWLGNKCNQKVKHAVAIASAQKNKASLEADSIIRAASMRVRFRLSTTPSVQASVSSNRNYWGLKILWIYREKVLLNEKLLVFFILER
ncbi:hypothetical protein Tco_0599604 [Tanacetum coccineum]